MPEPEPTMIDPRTGIALPEKQTVYHGTRTERTKADPGAAAALEREKQQAEEKQRQMREAEANTKLLREQAVKDAEAAAEQAERDRAARAEAEAERQQEIEGQVQERARRRADMEAKAKPTDFWDDRGGAMGRILGGLFSGLADNAWTRAGGQGPSPTTLAIDREIKRDRSEKLAAFENSKEFAALADKDVDEARKQRTEFLHDLDAKHVSAAKVAAGKAAAVAKRMGIPGAEADAQAAIAATAQKDAEQLAKDRAYLGTKTSSETPTTTVNEGKPESGAWAGRANSGDIERRFDLKKQARNKDTLADMIEADPAMHNVVKTAVQEQFKDAAVLDSLKGAAAGIGNLAAAGALVSDRATANVISKLQSAGASPEKLARAQEMVRFIGDDVARYLKLLSGASATEAEFIRTYTNSGALGDTKNYIKGLRRGSQDMLEEGADLERNKSFRDTPQAKPVESLDVRSARRKLINVVQGGWATDIEAAAREAEAAGVPREEILEIRGKVKDPGGDIKLADGAVVVPDRATRARDLEDTIYKIRGTPANDPARAALERKRRQLLGIPNVD